MKPESFEDKINNKFAGQHRPVPKGVWQGIESSLNADLVDVYSAEKVTYKWLAAAAVLLAAFMLGVVLNPFSAKVTSTEDSESFNALLTNSWEPYQQFKISNIQSDARSLSFQPVVVKSKTETVSEIYDESSMPSGLLFAISPKKRELALAEVDRKIYQYLSVDRTHKSTGEFSETDSRVWAGVEAGAGTFNADFAGSGALANSFNPAGLASAIGSDNFVNPTASIAQDMEEGVTTSLGIDFGMSIGKKWTLESGLAYTRMDNRGSASINVLDVYTIDNQEFISGAAPNDITTNNLSAREATIQVENTYDHEVTLNNTMQFATIPVKAGYFLMDRRVSLRVNAGLSANYLMNGDLSDPSRQILNSDELNIYNDWSFDGIGGLEIGYSIFDKFDLTLEPNYRHSITPISNSVNSPSRFVIQTGLRYTLK
ncbi:MAG: hypothetical protein HRT61_15530 [Ekhidna sp.]|nr:hypothetical protein [Ekhidna sp.]